MFLLLSLSLFMIQTIHAVKHDIVEHAESISKEMQLLEAIIVQDTQKIPELIKQTPLTSEHISQLGLLLVHLERNQGRPVFFKSLTDSDIEMDQNFFDTIKLYLSEEQRAQVESAKHSCSTLFGSGFGK